MRADNPLRHRQAKADAGDFFLGCRCSAERLKNERKFGFRYSPSVIGDLEQHLLTNLLQPQFDLASRWRVLECVAHQIVQDLLDPKRVAVEHDRCIRDGQCQFMMPRTGVEEFEYVFGNRPCIAFFQSQFKMTCFDSC